MEEEKRTESVAPEAPSHVASAAREPGMMSFVWEVVKFVILALVIVLPIRFYVAQPYLVSGDSMIPTFQNGNYLIVDQLSYRLREPERGDVIIFRYPLIPSRFFIKRVIGLPHETITVQNGIITITRTGEDGSRFVLEEPLIENYKDTFEAVLEDEEYFVMGDNRRASLDSRTWGPLSKDLIVGRALFRLVPVTGAAYLPGKIEYAEGSARAKETSLIPF